jgi:hypothetical protein
MNYWAYRIDNDYKDFFFDEIQHGRLRQGWGYSENQDLSKDNVDISARRNLPIYHKVKKGDYLLIPHIPEWDEIAIVSAIEDFDVGYRFGIDENKGDYGHIFPVKFVKRFSKYNINVDGAIRETFKCRSRFWSINKCEDEIKKILDTDNDKLVSASSYEARFRKQVENAFCEESFADRLYKELNETVQGPEWEVMLCEGLKKILPDSYSVQTTSNIEENKHGADIIIRIPGLLDVSYVIAIQVKDYQDCVGNQVVDQICKADSYFDKDNEILIDKYIIITRANQELNEQLKKAAEEKNVKILFDKDVKRLLSKISKAFLGETIYE